MEFGRELAAAMAAAKKAGEMLAAAYRRFQAIPDAPADISTEADRQSQELILNFLLQEFPQDAFCAEEATATLARLPRIGPRQWIIDPIDGTRGFARKNGEFSVMIGFVHHGEIHVGVVLEPAQNRVTYARRNGKCWHADLTLGNPAQCCVSPVGDVYEATLTQTHSRSPIPSPAAAAIGIRRVVESYSAGIKLALVARGEADLYVNTYQAFHDWDICAGLILVEEAGGIVSGLHGEKLTCGAAGAEQRHGLLATNGKIHASALQKLRGLNVDQ